LHTSPLTMVPLQPQLSYRCMLLQRFRKLQEVKDIS
jgi:hypothetical protein